MGQHKVLNEGFSLKSSSVPAGVVALVALLLGSLWVGYKAGQLQAVGADRGPFWLCCGLLVIIYSAIGVAVLRRTRTMNGWVRAVILGVALTCVAVVSVFPLWAMFGGF